MALLDIVQKGSTSRSVTVRIIDSSQGTPETGVVFDTAGIALWYRREGGLVVPITLADLTTPALDDAWETGGFLHISDGECRLDVPNAAFASGANHVDIGGTVTDMVVIGGRVRLIGYNPEGTGSGARTVSVTVNDGADNLENAIVRFTVTEGGNTYLGKTDENGLILFSLDDFTFGLAITKPGHSFTPTTLVVDGDKTETYSMTIDSISPPPSATTTTGVMKAYDEEQVLEAGVTITVQILDGPGTAGISYDSTVWTETSDGSGVVQFAGIVHGAQYKIWRGDSKSNAQMFTAPTTGDSFDLPEVIGRG